MIFGNYRHTNLTAIFNLVVKLLLTVRISYTWIKFLINQSYSLSTQKVFSSIFPVSCVVQVCSGHALLHSTESILFPFTLITTVIFCCTTLLEAGLLSETYLNHVYCLKEQLWLNLYIIHHVCIILKSSRRSRHWWCVTLFCNIHKCNVCIKCHPSLITLWH